MPELPDVETFCSYFEAKNLHQKIKDVQVYKPRVLDSISENDLRDNLKNRQFVSTSRYGKFMLVNTDSDFMLAVHFGLTGFFQNLIEGDSLPPNTRLTIQFVNDNVFVYIDPRMLGRVTLVNSKEMLIKNKKLGPDAEGVKEKDFIENIQQNRGSIKALLMDQHFIAGIGNKYSDEILFQSSIHPKTAANKLKQEEIKKLYKNLKSIFKTAVNKKVIPDKADKLPENWLIHRRHVKKAACPRCSGQIKTISIGGRFGYFCPNCQKQQ